jgi:pentatricopeptide repeat protein
MQTYVINNDPNMALKILDEMVEKGIEPDLPVYTTLINSFRVGRKLEKCWEVDKKMRNSKI